MNERNTISCLRELCDVVLFARFLTTDLNMSEAPKVSEKWNERGFRIYSVTSI